MFWSLGFVTWKLELLKQWDLGQRKSHGSCIYGPKHFLRFYDQLRIKEDNKFEEILEQKIIYSETGGMCWHHFFEK
jgi:hypothetical protein